MQLRATLSYICLSALVSACSSSWDLQGQDPHEYYEKHPVVNQVETRHIEIATHFEPRALKLSQSEIESVRNGLNAISSQAAQGILIKASSSMVNDERRQESLKKTLRSLGFTAPVSFAKSDTIYSNDILIDVTYSAIIPPDCPDWKMSPVTTFSNKLATNYGCAHAVNLGLMVNDPRDLVEGTGEVMSDTAISSKALTDYRSGTAAAGAAAAAP